MKEQLVSYFLAERRDGTLAVVAGIAALVAAAWLVGTRHSFRGAAVPLAAVALFELGVGVSYLARNAGLVASLLGQLQTAPEEMAQAELARMTPVLRNYRIVVLAELLLVAFGAILALMSRRDFLFAVGLGSILQGAPLLIADSLGARRAGLYIDALRTLLAGT